MSKPTISELQSQIGNLKSIANIYQKDCAKLKATLNDVLDDKNVVLKSDYDALLSSYKKLEERYKHLLKMYTADPDAKERLAAENIKLKATVNTLEKKSARKHNERGAGRKRLPIEQLAFEYRKSGMTIKEIAKALNVSIATVNRALNPKLRK
ncbi:winged helix-turn-helix transcriptional regulator [Desulfitobacterium sp. AusDCA]|uniref:winged helix-turn-helix transcriptional regulator n=1 Tax=Desulfitobacterium sp. AusDCA TaxID=3240383 RepID=UPI003DA78885